MKKSEFHRNLALSKGCCWQNIFLGCLLSSLHSGLHVKLEGLIRLVGYQACVSMPQAITLMFETASADRRKAAATSYEIDVSMADVL